MSDPPDPSLRLLAASALGERLAAMRQHIPGVREAEDIEAVHQMRVYSRRLRAALKVFQPTLPDKKAKRWRKEIRKVTKALGDARDLDVQIEFLDGVLADLDDRKLRPGIQRLRLRLSQRREQVQGRVNRAMDRFEQSEVCQQMSRDLHQMTVDAQLASADMRSLAVLTAARDRISVQLEDMLAYAPYIDQPELADELHQMRIAAKRLRYTMEVFAPVYDGELDAAIKQVKKVQSLLGDLHDCDVWLEFLPQFTEQERARTQEYFGHLRGFKRLTHGLDYLAQNRAAERNRLHRKFRQTYNEFTEQGAWDGIRETVRSAVARTANEQVDRNPLPEIVTSPLHMSDQARRSPGA